MHVIALKTTGDFLSEHLVQRTDAFILEHFEQGLDLRVDDHVDYGLGHHLRLVSSKVVNYHVPLSVNKVTCQCII